MKSLGHSPELQGKSAAELKGDALMASSLLELKNISKTFPGVKALDGVHFDLKAGEIHALMGENGAGKSTFIKVITGAHQPDPGGEIILETSLLFSSDFLTTPFYQLRLCATLCSVVRLIAFSGIVSGACVLSLH